MTESATQLNHLLDTVFQYGALWVYVVLFAACFIENIFPPFPGDSFIVAAGGLVAISRLNLFASFAVIVCGGMLSVMLLYAFGKRYGRDYFLRKNFKYFSAADVLRMEDRLKKWGPIILLCSRFVVGVRSAIAVAAGIGRYPNIKMIVFSTISYIVFSGLLMYVSIGLVRNLETVEEYFVLYDKIILPIIGILVVAYVVYKYRNMRKKV